MKIVFNEIIRWKHELKIIALHVNVLIHVFDSKLMIVIKKLR